MYLVKKFCDMVGVSYTTLRHYERIGLLEPTKSEENSYRQYQPEDAFMVNNFRYYRSIGFDTKTALKLTKEPDQSFVKESMKKRNDELIEELLIARSRIEAISRQSEDLERVKAERKFWFDQREDMYFLKVSQGEDFDIAEYKRMATWVDLLPITRYAKLVREVSSFGMSIESKRSYLLSDSERNASEFIKGGVCLYHYSDVLKSPYDKESVMMELKEYMEENDLTCDGDIYIEGTKLYDNNHIRGQIVSIPIKKKNNT